MQGSKQIPVTLHSITVPHGYRYVSQDLMGGVYCYKEKPWPGECTWITSNEAEMLYMGRENIFWNHTLADLEVDQGAIENGILKIRRGNANSKTA